MVLSPPRPRINLLVYAANFFLICLRFAVCFGRTSSDGRGTRAQHPLRNRPRFLRDCYTTRWYILTRLCRVLANFLPDTIVVVVVVRLRIFKRDQSRGVAPSLDSGRIRARRAEARGSDEKEPFREISRRANGRRRQAPSGDNFDAKQRRFLVTRASACFVRI